MGKNKIYSINPAREALEFLDDRQQGSTRPSTVIFCSAEIEDAKHAELLNKILSAAQLSEADRIIINLAEHPSIRLRALKKQFDSIGQVLLFGFAGRDVGLNTALLPYTVTSVGPNKVVSSDPLEMLSSNDQLKRLLWSSLQKMFA